MIGHQDKRPMRTLILIFSLLFFLQPASWATGVPAASEIHCQNERQAKSQLMLQGQALQRQGQADARMMSGKSLSHDNTSMADCQTACHAGCASPVSLTPSMSFTFVQQKIIVARGTPLLTFHSYTESPEIRPPLA